LYLFIYFRGRLHARVARATGTLHGGGGGGDQVRTVDSRGEHQTKNKQKTIVYHFVTRSN